jgi:hypothetical protein
MPEKTYEIVVTLFCSDDPDRHDKQKLAEKTILLSETQVTQDEFQLFRDILLTCFKKHIKPEAFEVRLDKWLIRTFPISRAGKMRLPFAETNTVTVGMLDFTIPPKYRKVGWLRQLWEKWQAYRTKQKERQPTQNIPIVKTLLPA